jgi:hypothetical protein
VSLDDIPVERRRAWVEMLTEAYAALMRELPGGNRLKISIRAFEDVNRGIPTKLLRAVYRESMRLRSSEGHPDFWDARSILAAYENHTGDWSTAGQEKIAKVAQSTAANCPMCFGVGMRRKIHPTDP